MPRVKTQHLYGYTSEDMKTLGNFLKFYTGGSKTGGAAGSKPFWEDFASHCFERITLKSFSEIPESLIDSMSFNPAPIVTEIFSEIQAFFMHRLMRGDVPSQANIRAALEREMRDFLQQWGAEVTRNRPETKEEWDDIQDLILNRLTLICECLLKSADLASLQSGHDEILNKFADDLYRLLIRYNPQITSDIKFRTHATRIFITCSPVPIVTRTLYDVMVTPIRWRAVTDPIVQDLTDNTDGPRTRSKSIVAKSPLSKSAPSSSKTSAKGTPAERKPSGGETSMETDVMRNNKGCQFDWNSMPQYAADAMPSALPADITVDDLLRMASYVLCNFTGFNALGDVLSVLRECVEGVRGTHIEELPSVAQLLDLVRTKCRTVLMSRGLKSQDLKTKEFQDNIGQFFIELLQPLSGVATKDNIDITASLAAVFQEHVPFLLNIALNSNADGLFALMILERLTKLTNDLLTVAWHSLRHDVSTIFASETDLKWKFNEDFTRQHHRRWAIHVYRLERQLYAAFNLVPKSSSPGGQGKPPAARNDPQEMDYFDIDFDEEMMELFQRDSGDVEGVKDKKEEGASGDETKDEYLKMSDTQRKFLVYKSDQQVMEEENSAAGSSGDKSNDAKDSAGNNDTKSNKEQGDDHHDDDDDDDDTGDNSNNGNSADRNENGNNSGDDSNDDDDDDNDDDDNDDDEAEDNDDDDGDNTDNETDEDTDGNEEETDDDADEADNDDDADEADNDDDDDYYNGENDGDKYDNDDDPDFAEGDYFEEENDDDDDTDDGDDDSQADDDDGDDVDDLNDLSENEDANDGDDDDDDDDEAAEPPKKQRKGESGSDRSRA